MKYNDVSLSRVRRLVQRKTILNNLLREETDGLLSAYQRHLRVLLVPCVCIDFTFCSLVESVKHLCGLLVSC